MEGFWQKFLLSQLYLLHIRHFVNINSQYQSFPRNCRESKQAGLFVLVRGHLYAGCQRPPGNFCSSSSKNGAPEQPEVSAISVHVWSAPQLPQRNKSLAAVIAGCFSTSYLQAMIFFYFSFYNCLCFLHLQSESLTPENSTGNFPLILAKLGCQLNMTKWGSKAKVLETNNVFYCSS